VHLQALKLRLQCLLEAVEGLDEEANVVRPSVIDEARRLLTIDYVFHQVVVEEGVLDVELVYRPVAHWRDVARWSTVWMDVGLTTGDNVW